MTQEITDALNVAAARISDLTNLVNQEKAAQAQADAAFNAQVETLVSQLRANIQ